MKFQYNCRHGAESSSKTPWVLYIWKSESFVFLGRKWCFKTEIGPISNSVEALKPFESSLIKRDKWKLQLLSTQCMEQLPGDAALLLAPGIGCPRMSQGWSPPLQLVRMMVSPWLPKLLISLYQNGQNNPINPSIQCDLWMCSEKRWWWKGTKIPRVHSTCRHNIRSRKQGKSYWSNFWTHLF